MLRGRVAGERGLDVGHEQRADARQLRAEFARELEGAFCSVPLARLAMLGQKTQRAADLLMQQTQRLSSVCPT